MNGESVDFLLLIIELNKVANRDQITLLKSSVARWNIWRENNPKIDPDLDRVDFNGVNLKNANL